MMIDKFVDVEGFERIERLCIMEIVWNEVFAKDG